MNLDSWDEHFFSRRGRVNGTLNRDETAERISMPMAACELRVDVRAPSASTQGELRDGGSGTATVSPCDKLPYTHETQPSTLGSRVTTHWRSLHLPLDLEHRQRLHLLQHHLLRSQAEERSQLRP